MSQQSSKNQLMAQNKRLFSNRLFIFLIDRAQRLWQQKAEKRQQIKQLLMLEDASPLFLETTDEIAKDAELAAEMAAEHADTLQEMIAAYLETLEEDANEALEQAEVALNNQIESGDVPPQAKAAIKSALPKLLSIDGAMRVARMLRSSSPLLIESNQARPSFIMPDAIRFDDCHTAMHAQIRMVYGNAQKHRQAGRHDESRVAMSQVLVFAEMARQFRVHRLEDSVVQQFSTSQYAQMVSILMTQLVFKCERPFHAGMLNQSLPFADVMRAGMFGPSFGVASTRHDDDEMANSAHNHPAFQP